jgi:hypothetical protein
MTDDLRTLFDEVGRTAPVATLDGDSVVRRGRRVRARRRAAVGVTSAVGVGALAAGAVAVASGLGGSTGGPLLGSAARVGATAPDATTFVSASGTASPPPVSVTICATESPCASPTPAGTAPPVSVTITGSPGTTPSPSGATVNPSASAPAELAAVTLADPAPGFPIRRWPDEVSLNSGLAGSTTGVWAALFGLAAKPETRTTSAAGNISGMPNGAEVTLFVAEMPMPARAADGTIEGNPVIATPTVAGVQGYVTSYSEKGTPIHELYADTGRFTVIIIGFSGVSVDELVALGNALTGLQ